MYYRTALCILLVLCALPISADNAKCPYPLFPELYEAVKQAIDKGDGSSAVALIDKELSAAVTGKPLGQADKLEGGQSPPDVHLHGDRQSGEPVHGAASDLGDQSALPRRPDPPAAEFPHAGPASARKGPVPGRPSGALCGLLGSPGTELDRPVVIRPEPIPEARQREETGGLATWGKK